MSLIMAFIGPIIPYILAIGAGLVALLGYRAKAKQEGRREVQAQAAAETAAIRERQIKVQTPSSNAEVVDRLRKGGF